MKSRMFIEVFPFAVLGAFGWYVYDGNDVMACVCLGAIILVSLARMGVDLKNDKL